MADLVTGISLVAGWDPRLEASAAEVFIYTKITPQPAAKVSLIHLQSLVAKATLLRVIPLLPDGTSPRESPGIRALGVPVVAGRNHTVSQTPVGQRRASEITLDGVGSNSSEDTSSDGDEGSGSPTHVEAPGKQKVDGMILKQIGDEVASYSSAAGGEPLTPKGLPGYQKESFGVSGKFNDSFAVETLSDGMDVITTLLTRPNTSSMYNFSGFQQGSSKSGNEFPASSMGVGHHRDASGNFKPAELSNERGVCRSLNESWDLAKPKSPKRKNRVFSISSMQRDLSPMTEKTLGRIVGLGASIKDLHPGGQDGAAEDSEAVLYSSEVAAESAAAAKESSSRRSDDGIPVEGEMIRQVASKTDESAGSEPEEIKMAIERDTLFICFPGNIHNDAVVVEVMLEIKPLYLEGKPYVTFIFAGLPYCDSGAYINFRINDKDDWKFNTFPEITPIEVEQSEENRLHGVLNLTGKLHPVGGNRSLIIRALRRPTVLEVLNFKMKSDINASFSWSPTDGQITSEFEINVVFLGLESDNDANRSLINFYLVNGPERQDDMIVDSPKGIPTEFILGDLDFENYENCARRCRLLRVERPTKDAHQPLRIRFSKRLGTKHHEIDIPIIRVGGEATLIKESIAVVKPRLPLEAVFSPNTTSWEKIDGQSEGKISKFTRTGINMREANPSILISCLNPVLSPTAERMNRVSAGDDGFIDRISYEVQESGSFDDRKAPVVVVSMRFSVEIPIGMEPMEEIVRIHTGSFGFNFATINGKTAGKSVFFEDGDEFLILNSEMITGGGSDGCKERLMMISLEWFSEQRLGLSCGEMIEFRLPRMIARVVGRIDFVCGSQQARIVSRTQHLNGNNVTSGFTNGKAIISGMDTNENEVFLQIPRRGGKDTCRARASKRSSKCSSPVTRGTVTPSMFSMSATSFHSILSESFETTERKRQEQLGAPIHDADETSLGVPISHWIWNTKDIVVMILMIGLLFINLISQSARNTALKTSLRHTRAMLEERERIIKEKSSENLPSHKLQKMGRGSEDLWWSMVGSGNIQEIGHFTVDVVTVDNWKKGSTCHATKGVTYNEQVEQLGGQDLEGECQPGEGRPVEEVTIGQNEEVVDSELTNWTKKKYEEEHQKRVAQILLEEETLKEKTQRIIVNVLRFFWFLVFGV